MAMFIYIFVNTNESVDELATQIEDVLQIKFQVEDVLKQKLNPVYIPYAFFDVNQKAWLAIWQKIKLFEDDGEIIYSNYKNQITVSYFAIEDANEGEKIALTYATWFFEKLKDLNKYPLMMVIGDGPKLDQFEPIPSEKE